MDIQKLKHLASEADRQVNWALVPFDLNKDEWETDVVNYIGAISPATIIELIESLEKAEAQIAELDERLIRYAGIATARAEHVAELEKQLAELAKQESVAHEANHCASVLEYIGQFDSEDIDSDSVDLRFEIEGVDTGSDVSITEYATRSAKVIRWLLARAAPPAPVKLPIAKHFGVIGTDEVCRAYPADAVIEAIKAAGGSVAE